MNVLVFDIGGTKTRFAVFSENGGILTRGELLTPQESREDLIGLLVSVFKKESGIKAVAVSMPGIIDPDLGYCKMGGALRYNDDFYFRDALQECVKVPVTIENNAKCAALAEASDGSLKDVADGMALFFDRMIGSGLIRDHKLFRGPHFSSGEVAYIVTVRNDMPDFETVWGNRCGMPRLCRMYERASRRDPGSVTPAEVLTAASNGEPDAIACLDTFAREIAVQIFNLQTILDVSRFALGGEAAAYPIFADAVTANLEEMYMVCPYDIPRAEVTVCRFREDASLIGAYHCFKERGAA